MENYQYYFKELNKDGSIRWVCKTLKCSSSITMKNENNTKVNGKSFDLEDLEDSGVSFAEKLKRVIKTIVNHCQKVCMDFNLNVKKRIVLFNKYFQMNSLK